MNKIKIVPEVEIKRRLTAGESVIYASRKLNPDVIGAYLPGWELSEINSQHPDWLKVYAEVRTKKQAHECVITQTLPSGLTSD